MTVEISELSKEEIKEMKNRFGIPEIELSTVCARDKKCAYCGKEMIYPSDLKNLKDSASIEHLNFDGPFHWKDGLEIRDIVMCCRSCNSSRGIHKLENWFKTKYCIDRNINENTVASPVKEYLNRKKNASPASPHSV